ncbi:thiamine biosynthesis protein ThiS [Bacillus glycinifermentans]|uniref:Sulfur carrier protein ThiS n=1 Tax=Bacillus glycinifermentans TaxID=1664069 RepID=A0A0J6EN96_9BACI|nr:MULTISPECIES: sulfur carrier protein ThiS [Bacillus]ATH95086.1 thiamine biosynthesis protein ThiS [Bacillus glycinifermentans]KKB73327.1 thiamine biosynthesis protein ThiS [Bacillus sp. TH008]KMM61981.1 thiamine biosynthesis protein ThiS [Bacillus glycinifermentans]KRT93276.1 thiamine biosynthesis protein ThiS [Bacillus glycinifermentans]MBU8787332.1 sulfur carrier protein ThiS [Bacillus glycinifermentans]
MMIQLNGRKIDWKNDGGTIYDLLASYQLENRVVIVERNREIIGKENYQEVKLEENDVIEIVHFVGGG